MAIEFWKTHEMGKKLPYGFMSNFSRHNFYDKKYEYKTSEHYFQAHKFEVGGKDFEDVVNAPTANDSAIIGRDRSRPLRKDWEQVKDDIMFDALKLKFNNHPDIRQSLIETGEEELIEASPVDSYWGWGSDMKGKNMLGKLLMKLRSFYQENN